MGAEVAASAEVDQVVGSHDDSGRDGSVHRGLGQTGRGTTDLKLAELNSSLEQRVSDRTKKLEEKNELMKKIAFMNSHQVRSSLTKVLGATYIFATDNDKREDMTGIIIDSATELDEVIKELGNTIANNENGNLTRREQLEKAQIKP